MSLKRKREDHKTFHHETREDWVQLLLDATPMCEDALHMTLDFVWPRKPMAHIITRLPLDPHTIDLTMDPLQGNLYLLCADHVRHPSEVKITVYSDDDFKQIACWGKVGKDVKSGQFKRPDSIAFCAASRQVLVFDSYHHVVNIFTPMGIFVRSFPLPNDPGRDSVLAPLVVSPQTHELYFGRCVGVWRYSLEGKCLNEKSHHHALGLNGQLDIAFAADGTLYRCDYVNMEIYNPEGKEVTKHHRPNFGVLF